MIPAFTESNLGRWVFQILGYEYEKATYAILKNNTLLVTIWRAVHTHFPASTLIDVVSDLLQATDLAWLSSPCRFCRRIWNPCGNSEKRRGEIRDVFVPQNKPPTIAYRQRSLKHVFLTLNSFNLYFSNSMSTSTSLWRFRETHSEVTAIAIVRQRHVLTYKVTCNSWQD